MRSEVVALGRREGTGVMSVLVMGEAMVRCETMRTRRRERSTELSTLCMVKKGCGQRGKVV